MLGAFLDIDKLVHPSLLDSSPAGRRQGSTAHGSGTQTVGPQQSGSPGLSSDAYQLHRSRDPIQILRSLALSPVRALGP